MSKLPRYLRVLVGAGIMFVAITHSALSQEKPAPVEQKDVPQEVPAEVRKMTPEQIDARLQAMGLTRDQAATQAKQQGVNIESLLAPSQQRPSQTVQNIEGVAATGEQEAAPEQEAEVVQPEQQEPQIAERDLIGPGGLRYFGYDVFQNVPAAFEPQASGPIDPEYVIGPDDVLRITVWGQVEFQNEFSIDKEGRIFISTIGQVFVSGLTLEKAYDKLKRAMSKSYSGLTSQPPTVWIDVTLARLRPKRIFIMGQVRQPGGYTVSSYSTVFNSLYAVGGPTVKGSLREIRIIRNDKIVGRVDLYTYLTGASRTNDVRVQNNDIIFVPVRGKTVSLSGEVRLPGIYELKAREGLSTLLSYAGGLLTTAFTGRIQVERILPMRERSERGPERVVIDIDGKEVFGKKKSVHLEDGDVVKVFSISDSKLNFVTINGPVSRPGTYQLERVRTVRDLIIAADSLLPLAYPKRAEIVRTRPDLTLEAIEIDLTKALEGDTVHNRELAPLDQIQIFSILDMESRPPVILKGHVRRPGTYAYADSLTLFDLLFRAGGLQDSVFRAQAFLPRADLYRLDPDGLTKSVYPFDLGALLMSRQGDRPLEPGDEIIVYREDVYRTLNRYIDVYGKVRNPGRYEWKSNMTLTDAILAAGGYTEDASQLRAEIARYPDSGLNGDSISRMYYADLPRLRDTTMHSRLIRADTRASDFQLEHRDVIYVRPNPEYRDRAQVLLQGEVVYPGRYALLRPNETLADVIKRAGGITPLAFLDGGRIFRAGRRVNNNFIEALAEPHGDHDLVLHDGDEINIPVKPNAIDIQGEVYNPGILGYIRGDKLSDYIQRAGGLTDSAAYILLEYPSGDVNKRSAGGFAAFFEKDPQVHDGSRIIVTRTTPEPESEKVDWSATIKDVLALTASLLTIVVLANRL